MHRCGMATPPNGPVVLRTIRSSMHRAHRTLMVWARLRTRLALMTMPGMRSRVFMCLDWTHLKGVEVRLPLKRIWMVEVEMLARSAGVGRTSPAAEVEPGLLAPSPAAASLGSPSWVAPCCAASAASPSSSLPATSLCMSKSSVLSASTAANSRLGNTPAGWPRSNPSRAVSYSPTWAMSTSRQASGSAPDEAKLEEGASGLASSPDVRRCIRRRRSRYR
jgi:hypothetical protein